MMIGNLLALRRTASTLASMAHRSHRLIGHASTLARRFASDTGRRPLYYPKHRLKFVDGRLLIAEARFRGFYMFSSLALAGLTLTTAWSARKLYRYSDRSAFGIVFYGCLLITSMILLRSCHASMSELITKVWLKQTGRSVIVQKASPLSRSQEFDIECISRPDKLPMEFVMSSKAIVGYPVLLDGNYYMMPKDMTRYDQEVFGAVFSGMNVAVGESTDDIIVE